MDTKSERICPVCGKGFVIKSTAHNRRYCSEQCKNEEMAKKAKRWRSEHSAFKPTTKTCPICGKTFDILKGSGSRRIYCSLKCRNKMRDMKLAIENENRKKPKDKKKITRLYTPFKCGGMSIDEISIKASKKRMTYGQYTSRFCYDISHVEEPLMFGVEEKKYNYVKFKWKKSEGRKDA